MEQEDIITIDFKALFKVLWKEKWLIIAITLLFTIGGTWYAFTAREEFVSEGKILPEVTSGGNSSLGGLANMIGIGGFELGLKNNTDAIRPDLYPAVIESTPFYLELLNQNFQTKNGNYILFEKFYNLKIENNNKAEPEFLIKFKANPKGIIIVNRITEERIKDLKSRINASIDKKSGLITISVKMPDPVLAAEISKFAMGYLTEYVTNYRTEKLKQEVDFLGQKVASAKGEYYKDQSRKASYADQFYAPTIRLQSADIQRERLESQYKMSSNVYSELLKKFEEAKIKLQQETPIFQILDPPVVSNLKSEPKKSLIILGAAFIGVLMSFLIVIMSKGNYKTFLN